jgi:hypothetical protein
MILFLMLTWLLLALVQVALIIAHELAVAGKSVIILEAGRYVPSSNLPKTWHGL